jgi:hypothetical protein
MPADTVFDSADKETLRPNEDLISKQGAMFKPTQLPNWEYEMALPVVTFPDSPITLFTM